MRRKKEIDGKRPQKEIRSSMKLLIRAWNHLPEIGAS
jgi:hypothetical protein